MLAHEPSDTCKVARALHLAFLNLLTIRVCIAENVVTAPNYKNQHYVWRHYLNAWAADGTFCCYRHKDKKLFPTRAKSVANENYFYETQELTAGDLKFLDDFIGRATEEELRKINREYVQLTQLSFNLRKRLKQTDLAPGARVAIEDELRWAEKNLGERYHTGIENKCSDILESLRTENDDFYNDEVRAVDFIYFLSLQYFRTAKMRDGLSKIPTDVPGHDPRRTANILNHTHATNVGAGLYRERRSYRQALVPNGSGGGQPVSAPRLASLSNQSSTTSSGQSGKSALIVARSTMARPSVQP